MVEEIFQTDPISALGLPPPVSIGRTATVGEALDAVKRHGQGYVLIIDGQNNHGWNRTTPILKWIFEDSGRFNVEVSTTPGSAPRAP